MTIVLCIDMLMSAAGLPSARNRVTWPPIVTVGPADGFPPGTTGRVDGSCHSTSVKARLLASEIWLFNPALGRSRVRGSSTAGKTECLTTAGDRSRLCLQVVNPKFGSYSSHGVFHSRLQTLFFSQVFLSVTIYAEKVISKRLSLPLRIKEKVNKKRFLRLLESVGKPWNIFVIFVKFPGPGKSWKMFLVLERTGNLS